MFNNYSDRLAVTFGEFLPNVLAAIAVLVLGWLVALAISKLIKAGLRRTQVDDRLARSLQSDPDGPPPNVEELVGKIVFWILMAMVLVAFFQVLGLGFVAGPLGGFLNEIFAFLPKLLAAALLMILAWLVARLLRFLVQKGARSLNLDEKLAEQSTPPEEDSSLSRDPASAATTPPPADSRRPALSKTLGETAYWLTFLLFLPLVLDVLDLDGLLEPVDNLVGRILGFLPNLLAAALILALGWLVARILQRIVTNLLAAAGFNRLGERIGLSRAAGGRTPSQIVGLILYILVLIPVIIAALNALAIEAVTEPASQMLNRILLAIPNLLAAAAIITLAWLIGRVVAGLVANLLASFGFDRFLDRIGLVSLSTTPEPAPESSPESGRPPEQVPTRRPSEIVGYLVLIGIVLFAVIEALSLLDMELLAAMVTEFTIFAGNVLLGVLIFIVGYYLAGLAADLIRSSDVKNEDLLATLAKGAILVLATVMALRQAGLAEDVILLTFGLLLGAAAVAAAIAFGIGGRDIAKQYVERWTQKAETRSSSPSGSGGSPPPRDPRPPAV